MFFKEHVGLLFTQRVLNSRPQLNFSVFSSNIQNNFLAHSQTKIRSFHPVLIRQQPRKFAEHSLNTK